MTDERRIHPRHESRLTATLGCGGLTVEGVIENIGAGGVFFATEDLEVLIDEGAAVTLCFDAVRDGRTSAVECQGSVLRAERYFDGERVVRAFAVRFDEQLDVTGLDIA